MAQLNITDFKNHNVAEIREEQQKGGKNLPALTFKSKVEVEPGYYTFEIGDARFSECWLQPAGRDEAGMTFYNSGSYKVIFDV